MTEFGLFILLHQVTFFVNVEQNFDLLLVKHYIISQIQLPEKETSFLSFFSTLD